MFSFDFVENNKSAPLFLPWTSLPPTCGFKIIGHSMQLCSTFQGHRPTWIYINLKVEILVMTKMISYFFIRLNKSHDLIDLLFLGEIVTKPSWGKDQPNNYGNGEQNCVVLDGGRAWLWNDVGCNLDYLHWICQYRECQTRYISVF